MDRAGSINSLETNVGGEGSKSTLSSISDTMDVLLTQPKLTRKVKKKQESKNAMAVCITDDVFVDRLMDEKENKKKSTKKGASKQQKKKGRSKRKSATQKHIQSQTEESDCECPLCGEHYGERSATWIQCNGCEQWYDTGCAGINEATMPDEYLCDFCCV